MNTLSAASWPHVVGRRWRRRAAAAAVIALLSLAPAPAAARSLPGRLELSLVAAGGWASDVFAGAGLGQDGFVQLTPGAHLDLSFGPEVKLGADADVALGRYASSELSSVVETASVEGRFFPTAPVEASLTVSGDHGSWSIPVPLDPTQPTGPSVSSTTAARLSPLVRARALGLELRAGGVVGVRTSTAGEAELSETDLSGVVGAMRAFDPRGSVALSYRLARVLSARPDVAATSHALFGAVSFAPFARLDLRAEAQLQRAALGTGFREDLARLTLGGSLALTRRLDAELVLVLAAIGTDDPGRPGATLALALAALRFTLPEITW